MGSESIAHEAEGQLVGQKSFFAAKKPALFATSGL